jgi:branched-chain amino acid transport system ATP-binding protein
MRHSRFALLRARSALREVAEEADHLLPRVGLAAVRYKPAADLALTSKLKLLLMDEPTAGMSPEETRTMMDLITTLASECTVVLVEHKMKMVMGLCERLIVLHHGELLAEGSPDEIRGNAEVRRVYLGQG